MSLVISKNTETRDLPINVDFNFLKQESKECSKYSLPNPGGLRNYPYITDAVHSFILKKTAQGMTDEGPVITVYSLACLLNL